MRYRNLIIGSILGAIIGATIGAATAIGNEATTASTIFLTIFGAVGGLAGGQVGAIDGTDLNLAFHNRPYWAGRQRGCTSITVSYEGIPCAARASKTGLRGDLL